MIACIFQTAFGWTNSHLFEFFAGDVHWGIADPDNDYGHQPIDARKARLSDIVQETGVKTIHYLYDFGDSWDHVIKLEKWCGRRLVDFFGVQVIPSVDMAKTSDFTIVTYERAPGHWRAAFTPKRLPRSTVLGWCTAR